MGVSDWFFFLLGMKTASCVGRCWPFFCEFTLEIGDLSIVRGHAPAARLLYVDSALPLCGTEGSKRRTKQTVSPKKSSRLKDLERAGPSGDQLVLKSCSLISPGCDELQVHGYEPFDLSLIR